jgi:hypothetical protein
MGGFQQRNGDRTLEVNKADVIKAVKANKKAHQEAYAKAVVAYKKEALKQLAEQTKKAEAGDLKVRLDLTTPVDMGTSYDDIIEMFEFDVNDVIELTQREYNEYVKDKTESARHALMSNSMYLGD